MCRNIRPLFNYEPPATKQDIQDASLQFVRKISGYQKPSKVNEKPFNQAVDEVTVTIDRLMSSLATESPPHDRAKEIILAKQKSKESFG